ITIKCVPHAKLLGVHIDQELRWHHHVDTAVAKGTKLLLAAKRLTRPSFGLPPRYIRRIYTSVVVPRVEYALPVWYEPTRTIPGRKFPKGSTGFANRIGKVQRLACQMITGAFRCTATDVLELHANIKP
ncbi:hypothetical protein B0H21DRAFT_679346, partial [Amylocystis lapponica]